MRFDNIIGMKQNNNNLGQTFGEIGCKFRSIIESHIKDYQLQKEDDVEWLLEPLNAISHSPNIVIDAFKYGTRWESFYQLYFHNRDAKLCYDPYNLPPDSDLLSDIKKGWALFYDEKQSIPTPAPYDKSMLIQDKLDIWSKKEIPSIWDELIVQFTETGVWQAVLLNEIIALFPKGWHANYIRKTYVFSIEDMQQIIDSKKSKYTEFTEAEKEKLDAYLRFLDRPPHYAKYKRSDYERLVSCLSREDILPSVEINGDEAVASYYYWNEWSGFCKGIVPVKKNGKSVTFGEFERQVLVEYDCGIRY